MKRLIISLVTVFTVGALATGATSAYFSSLATSSSNTVASGSMTILLSDADDTDLATISNSWEGSNLAPGSDVPQSVITVKNTGTINGNHLDLVVSLNPNNADLADYIFFKQADGDNGLRFGASSSPADSVNIISYLLGTGANDGDYDLYDGDDGTTSLYATWAGRPEVSLQDLADLGRIRIVADSNSEGITAATQALLWVNATVGTGLTTQGETVNASLAWTLHQVATQY